MNEELEIINMSAVMEAKDVMGEERFPSLVEYFTKDTETYISEIEVSLEGKNELQAIIPPAHTIKSSAKQLGAERVSFAAEQIEERCRNFFDDAAGESTEDKLIEELKPMYEELKHEFEAAAHELNEICNQ